MRGTRLVIRTPEGVEFGLPVAGPAVRMLALLLDLAVISAATSTLAKVLAPLRAVSDDLTDAAAMVSYFAISVIYSIACEWLWRGQTVGKRAMKIRVMDARGGRLEPSQIVMRNLLRFADQLPGFYLLGGAVCLFNRNLQRLGDMAAQTVVVRADERVAPDLEQLLGAKFNSMLAHRHLAARLRQRTPPELAGAALEALTRREELEPAARLEVFGELAERFKALVAFPPEAVEALADEQYVRNAVEIVFRPR